MRQCRQWQGRHKGSDGTDSFLQRLCKLCLIYLRRLNIGGQDWGEFFAVVEPIARQVAQSPEFLAIIPAILDLADALNEFRLRTYEKWVTGYLSKELRKEASPACGEAPV